MRARKRRENSCVNRVVDFHAQVFQKSQKNPTNFHSHLLTHHKFCYCKIVNLFSSTLKDFQIAYEGGIWCFQLWPFGEKLIFGIVTWSTVHDSTICTWSWCLKQRTDGPEHVKIFNQAGLKLGSSCYFSWVVAWLLDILIGQLVAAWPFKISSNQTTKETWLIGVGFNSRARAQYLPLLWLVR